MNLVPAATLATVAVHLDERLEGIHESYCVNLDNPHYGPALRWYLLFTHAPDLIHGLNRTDVFYNRYLWLRRFATLYQSVHGVDAGIEQHVFQLLATTDVEVEWDCIQRIDEVA